MTDMGGKSACTVRITVKLRPEEYDELFRHVCAIGSTMSAFFRQSAARAIKEEPPDTGPPPLRQEESLAANSVRGECWPSVADDAG